MIGLFKKRLPDCDTLFRKFFSPWYDEDDRPDMTRPDMYVISGYDGEPVDLDQLQYHLSYGQMEHNKKQLEIMANAALADYQHIIQSNRLDLNVLDAVDEYYDRKKISEIIRRSDPADFTNDYLIEVCEFGAMLGYLFNQIEGYGWLYSHPYFHSIIVHKESGYGITVFDWAIKKFSSYGVKDGYAAKFQTALEVVKEPK